MGLIGCHKTSLRNCYSMLRNIPEERRSLLHPGGCLKSSTFHVCVGVLIQKKLGDTLLIAAVFCLDGRPTSVIRLLNVQTVRVLRTVRDRIEFGCSCTCHRKIEALRSSRCRSNFNGNNSSKRQDIAFWFSRICIGSLLDTVCVSSARRCTPRANSLYFTGTVRTTLFYVGVRFGMSTERSFMDYNFVCISHIFEPYHNVILGWITLTLHTPS